MKINSPFLNGLGGLLGSTLIRNWMGTLDYKVAYYDPAIDPALPVRTPKPRGLKIDGEDAIALTLRTRLTVDAPGLDVQVLSGDEEAQLSRAVALREVAAGFGLSDADVAPAMLAGVIFGLWAGPVAWRKIYVEGARGKKYVIKK